MPKEKIKRSELFVLVEVTKETRQEINVLASLEGQTTADFIGLMVKRAYEATIHNRGRKAKI